MILIQKSRAVNSVSEKMCAEKDEKGRFMSRHPDYKYSTGRRNKRPRRFLGKNNENEPSSKSRPSTSSTKIQTPAAQGTCETRNRLIDINILFPELQEILCCSQCHGKVKLSESGIQGFGFKIDVSCENCGQVAAVNSCKKVGINNHAWEVNRRSVLAFRALGHGHAGMQTFCGIMDCLKPVAQSAFDTINEQLSEVCTTVAKESMKAAVIQEKEATSSDSPGLNISGDGSWRKKGFSSLQGFASVVGHYTGKVLDVAIKNSFCKSCSAWENRQDSAEYEEWFKNHEPDCTANHAGSAGKMEVDGICEIFQRSEEEYNVKYHRYIGDGDSKVFKSVSEAKPYGDTLVVEKRECIAHVQKRMGTRLRNFKKSCAGKKLADNKTIGGRGRLTAKVIDKLSGYYGKAIRSYPESVEDMYNAIWATFYHVQSTDTLPQHHLCPSGSDSWCAWQKQQAAGNLEGFSHKNSLPSVVMDEIRHIYEDLSKSELLERCLGGFTQNSNESFNNSVWRFVPKTSFSGLTVFKIGVNTAVTTFNDGRSGFLRIMKTFDIEPGHAAAEWVNTSDNLRIFHAERQTLASTKEARTLRRRAREQELADDSYAAGAH